MEIYFSGKRLDNGQLIQGYYVKRHFTNSQSHHEYEHYILTGEFISLNSEQYEININTLCLEVDGVILRMDGNQVCATNDDFINLQESIAGFGDSVKNAISDLCKQEATHDNN